MLTCRPLSSGIRFLQASDRDLGLVFCLFFLAAALFALLLGEVGIIVFLLTGLTAGTLVRVCTLAGLFGIDAGAGSVVSLFAHHIPDGARKADGGVGTSDGTDHARKANLLDT